MQLTLRRAVAVVGAAGAAAALVTAVAGFVLAESYRPGPSAVAASDWHRVGSVVLLASAVIGLALQFALAARGGVRRTAVVTSAVVLVLAALVVATKSRVEWDQIGLWAVVPNLDLSGYWTAAFGDEARFVLADGRELSQGAYATGLLVHLTAPVLCGALLLWEATKARGARRSIDTSVDGP